MNNHSITQTREQWAKASLDMINLEIIQPVTSLPIPPIRVSIAMLGKKTLGECYPRSRSKDGVNEIFITATCDDSMKHLATLAHEAIHAFDDCQSGHKGTFATIARAIGLEGKLTATHVTDASPLFSALTEIHHFLGDIPHAEISTRVKDTGNRNGNKITCGDCGFKANTSAKWAIQISSGFDCPVCKGTNTSVIKK